MSQRHQTQIIQVNRGAGLSALPENTRAVGLYGLIDRQSSGLTELGLIVFNSYFIRVSTRVIEP